MGANVLGEFKMFFLIGGIFFKLEAMGANVLVEFENVFLIVGIFLQLGAKNYLGSKKISYFGNYMDPWGGGL